MGMPRELEIDFRFFSQVDMGRLMKKEDAGASPVIADLL
jgi:hypothetical protein